MTKSRDHHYVPIWYQEDFFEPGHTGLTYLNLSPEVIKLPNGSTKTLNDTFVNTAPRRCFFQTDLYSTFFGPIVNVDIETMLFGALDTKGSAAVRAIAGTDVREWHKHFQNFFEYLDAQKLRTPKGLEWLKLHYPRLSQNDLMIEMQGVRKIHCTLWTQGVWEVVSAEDAGVKFIVSDHPITVYNYAIPPEDESNAYPNDPQIALKASQTIYPLNRNFCMILTNLEYAKSPDLGDPTNKRTFARNFRQSMARIDAFIRGRKLNDLEVSQINFIIKSRARRYIAAGKKDWLYPERVVTQTWKELRTVLLPPSDKLWHFGGEMFAKFEDGRVYYQDEFGRTEPPSDYLSKQPPKGAVLPTSQCGCGSGRMFKKCCMDISLELRPSWTELSIRERNITLYNAIIDILGLNSGKDWAQVRREITDEKIVKIYSIFEALWPKDTDLISLMPKPDGRTRAIYTGLIDPPMVFEFLTGATLYAREILVQNPFLYAGNMNPDFSPTKNPHLYRQEFLKSVLAMMYWMPFVERGMVILFPDPCYFDYHMMSQMMAMAEQRTAIIKPEIEKDTRNQWATEQEGQRAILALPQQFRESQIEKAHPQISALEKEKLIRYINIMREKDPFSTLQEDEQKEGKEGGLMNILKMSPNFEITLYLAQATGSYIITDSQSRWNELLVMHRQQMKTAGVHFPKLNRELQKHLFLYPLEADDALALRSDKRFSECRNIIQDMYEYLTNVSTVGIRAFQENALTKRLIILASNISKSLKKSPLPHLGANITLLAPIGGFGHPTINRLLLQAGVDHYLDRVPLAFFIERPDKDIYTKRDWWK